jgi:6-pyruvoyltetrahydropterin/6-carboxytetrahydropterin synthase
MFEICVEHTFAAAHFLRNYYGKCENLHGHNYRVQVGMEGELDETGLLFDFAKLKDQLRQTSAYLDHQLLNELRPFDEINPSAENIAKFICEDMQQGLSHNSPQAKISYVRVWETDTSYAVYRP